MKNGPFFAALILPGDRGCFFCVFRPLPLEKAGENWLFVLTFPFSGGKIIIYIYL